MNKHKRLFFQDVEVGEIAEENSDFPNLFGLFYANAKAADSPLHRKLQSYIEYSVATDTLMQEGKEQDRYTPAGVFCSHRQRASRAWHPCK